MLSLPVIRSARYLSALHEGNQLEEKLFNYTDFKLCMIGRQIFEPFPCVVTVFFYITK